MLEHGEPGHVVNTASIGGLLPYAGIAAYTATKYAVVGLSNASIPRRSAGSACPSSVRDHRDGVPLAQSRAAPRGPAGEVTGE